VTNYIPITGYLVIFDKLHGENEHDARECGNIVKNQEVGTKRLCGKVWKKLF